MGVTTNTANRITSKFKKVELCTESQQQQQQLWGLVVLPQELTRSKSAAPFSRYIFLATVILLTTGTQYANGFSTSVAGATKTSSGTTTEFSSTAFSTTIRINKLYYENINLNNSHEF
jgi:hypothetical protein